MAFAMLQLPTLFVVSALVVGFLGLALIAVLTRERDRSSLALVFWGTAMVAGAGGLVCFAFERAWGDGANEAADTLILLGTGLSWTGARAFDGRRLKPALVVAGPVAWLLVVIGPLSPARPVPSILCLLLGSAYTLATAAELWRGRSEHLRSRVPAVVILLLHASVYLGRACYEIFGSLNARPLENDISAILVIEALLHTLALAFLLLALTRERAQMQSTARLLELASHDGLTGLGNRRAFDGALERAFQHATRDRTPLALLMIDIDYFKTYNDTYGHPSGDECLRAIAAAIRSAARGPDDVGSRYGGDECAMLLPRTDAAEAARVARIVFENVTALGIEHRGSPRQRVGVSIGGAVVSPHPRLDGPERLLRAADLALYEAKGAGRGRIRIASETILLERDRALEGGLAFASGAHAATVWPMPPAHPSESRDRRGPR